MLDLESVLDLVVLEMVEGQDISKVMLCGDFNAHNKLWGGNGWMEMAK